MIGNIHSNYFVLSIVIVLALFAGSVAQAAQNTVGHLSLIEVLITADSHVTGEVAIHREPGYRGIEFQVYELDGIHLFETELSNSLPPDPKQSKQIALQRIQQLDGQVTAAIQNTTVGLAKVIQYGVDRYPAIVFDGEVVVYGLTDLSRALDHYQTWRTGARP